MSPENSEKLIAIYPQLFQQSGETCFNLFGFECGDGWFNLLKDLITNIKDECDKPLFKNEMNDEMYELKVDQIKEKYGTLRFYTNFSNSHIDALIRDAEEESSKTCEACGKSAKMRSDHRWYSVRCDDCWPKPSKWS
jgi:hypothetical protein